MWTLHKGKNLMGVAKVGGPDIVAHGSMFYTVLRRMLEKKYAKGELKGIAETLSKSLNDTGTVKMLSDEEMREEIHRFAAEREKSRKKHAAAGAEAEGKKDAGEE